MGTKDGMTASSPNPPPMPNAAVIKDVKKLTAERLRVAFTLA